MENQPHFKLQHEEKAFYPPTDIIYSVYSSKIWEKFLSLMDDKKYRIADFGCGGGTLLFCLEELGYKNLYGVDFVNSIPDKFLEHTTFLKKDITDTEIDSNYFDAICSTMVIEHIKDESKLVGEMYKVLGKNGIILITSVFKKKWAWYFHKNKNGERVLESTHLREYTDCEQFLCIFKNKFKIIEKSIIPLKYPIIDPIFKLLFILTKNNYLKYLATSHFLLKKIRKIRIPIPGYFAIEVIAMKKS